MKHIITLAALLIMVMSAQAQSIYFVDSSRADNLGAGTSWATAKKDLQEAINIAAPGSQIWIRKGTYYPTTDHLGSATPTDLRKRTFLLRDSLALYGGFAGTEALLSQRNSVTNPTILSGDFNGNDTRTGSGATLVIGNNSENAYHVIMHVGNFFALLDGLDISGGNGTNLSQSITVNGQSVNQAFGSGLYSSGSRPIRISNCTFSYNATTDVGIGAGAYLTTNAEITNCVFSFNDGSNGGGLAIISRVFTISNCRFLHNNADFGGGLLCRSNASAILSGCNFLDNTASTGAMMITTSRATFNNCVFQSNGGSQGAFNCTQSKTTFNNSAFIDNIASGFARSILTIQDNDSLIVNNCIFLNKNPVTNDEIQLRGGFAAITNSYIGGIVNVLAAARPGTQLRNNILPALNIPGILSANNLIGQNPFFVNLADPAGPDGVFFTADDGLRLQCSSPAINAGNDTTTTTDILGTPRIGKPDIGAYEATDTNNNIAATTSSAKAYQRNATVYGACTRIIARIIASGADPVGDSTTARVWIETATPTSWVKRHYEITPAVNAATATGSITLFFTQQEFDAFNSYNTKKLPANSADATGKANLLIEKWPGTSSNGTGLPNSYSGTPVNIDPADADIIWNARQARWEITFSVTGFSGFFVKTASTPLPLNWLSVNGRLNIQQQALISWTVAEHGVSSYKVERSNDGRQFASITTIDSKGNGENKYAFTDNDNRVGDRYYRIRQTGHDGSYSYSTIMKIATTGNGVAAHIYPNPATVMVMLETDPGLINTSAQLIDMNGVMVRQWALNGQQTRLDLSGLAAGIYVIKLGDGQVIRLTKQ